MIIACDSGGTMCDTFVLTDEGEVIRGKASTTPEDESVGFWNSLCDAFESINIDLKEKADEIVPSSDLAVYSGTTMLNALITRGGRDIGLLVTKGMEDAVLHERGKQVYAGYSYQDTIHKATHAHNPPLVPRNRVKGVTERTNIGGVEDIPLCEEETREALRDLLEKDIEAIAICFLCSFMDESHETKAKEIAKEVMEEEGVDLPVYLSSEVCPIIREQDRMNSTILQAKAAEPVRNHLRKIDKKLTEHGYERPLQVILADGGIANIEYPMIYKSIVSGPIGGLTGARYFSKTLDEPNIVCTDLGGTSFDVGLIMNGEPIIEREVEFASAVLNIPTLYMDSIAAGTGSYVKAEEKSGRIEIGPGSAGADPGPVAYGRGNEQPTITDFLLIAGFLNPNYYLGGKIELDKDLALEMIEEKCANIVGMDPYELATGVIDRIKIMLRNHIRTVLSVRGYSPSDYYLLSYGGAGPVLMEGYLEDINLKGVFTVPWAATFSAYGCSAVDFTHRYQRSTMIQLEPMHQKMIKCS